MNTPKSSQNEPQQSFLSLRDISLSYGSTRVLNDVSLDVRAGEMLCLLGPSGCGKTTLLRVIAGLARQDQGSLQLAGRDISRAAPQQRNYGIVFQSYALFPNLTVAANVAYGLSSRHGDRAAVARRVEEMLDLVGLPGSGRKYPGQLSGGQQQRVALARALAPAPMLLLLDEPMSALDAKVREHLRSELRSLQRRLSVTTIMVTHDQEEAMSMADRIAVMNRGNLEQVGTPRELYRHPVSGFIAGFIGEANWLPYERLTDGRVTIGRWTAQTANDLAQPRGRLFARPEAIRILPGGTLPSGDNIFAAEIQDGIFLGRQYRLRLALEGVPGVDLHAFVNAEQGDALLAKTAARRCWLSIAPAALRAYES
ncbi:putative 2-aminoethylphosphonate ABC transporter ATP-binding protein [Kerstersia similis]|uniref:putative 2-aminoethylphosphonate ABC transporter ATP-binding protein n=1 Tax=Kerstersia similis TaxID=206505 RepID=UPI0039EFBBA4